MHAQSTFSRWHAWGFAFTAAWGALSFVALAWAGPPTRNAYYWEFIARLPAWWQWISTHEHQLMLTNIGLASVFMAFLAGQTFAETRE